MNKSNFLILALAASIFSNPAQASSPPASTQASSSQDAAGNIQFLFNNESSIKIAPVTTAATEETCLTESEGAMRYNKTLKIFEGCDGTSWRSLSSNAQSGSLANTVEKDFSGAASDSKRIVVDTIVTIYTPSSIVASGSSNALLHGASATGTLNNITEVENASGVNVCQGIDNNPQSTPSSEITLRSSSSCIATVSPGKYTIKSITYLGQHDITGTLTHRWTRLNYLIVPRKS